MVFASIGEHASTAVFFFFFFLRARAEIKNLVCERAASNLESTTRE